MTIEIQLTKGLIALVDDEDADLARRQWWACNGYAIGCGARRLGMHRLILERMLGASIPLGFETDHINRNRADNRRANLRLVTHAANIANSEWKRGRSDYRGVALRMGKYWCAKIQINGKQYHLGDFATAREAAIAYNQAAVDAWGEHAILNDV